MEQFSEATIGYRSDKNTARSWVQAFATPYFHVAAVSHSSYRIFESIDWIWQSYVIWISNFELIMKTMWDTCRWAYLTLCNIVSQVHDVEGVELCGTLKNVVAIAAGQYQIFTQFGVQNHFMWKSPIVVTTLHSFGSWLSINFLTRSMPWFSSLNFA